MTHRWYWLAGLAAIGMLLALGTAQPGCGSGEETGIWLRITSAKIPIAQVTLEIYDATSATGGLATSAPVTVFVPGEPRVFDSESVNPENQLWVLIYAGDTVHTRVRVVGIGLREDSRGTMREVARGEIESLDFVPGRTVEAEQMLDLSKDAVDGDNDTYYPPDDCNDDDPAINPGMPEICDELDNNCDKSIDEGCDCSGDSRECWPDWLPEPVPDSPCHKGTQPCVGGQWGTCDGVDIGIPESCSGTDFTCFACINSIDDDCDGFVDDYDTGCGGCTVGAWETCYTGPAGTEGVPLCHAGNALCLDGHFGECQNEYTPLDEVCDGFDNDCDGQTDETDDMVMRQDCPLALYGVCTGTLKRCEGGVQVDCTPADYEDNARARLCGATDPPLCCSDGSLTCYAPVETTDLCDEVDNDCNGRSDDVPGGGCTCNYGATRPCPESTPTGNLSEGACNESYETCIDNDWIPEPDCVGPVPEACNNVDDDCDGTTDTGEIDASQDCVDAVVELESAGRQYHVQLQATATACSGGHCTFACMAGWWDLARDMQDVAPANLSAADGCEYGCDLSVPTVERCDGVDNDCDGLTDAADNNPSQVTLTTLCPGRTNAGVSQCTAGACNYACTSPFEDCNADLHDPVPLDINNETSDGCEINLSTDRNNCGACDHHCGANAHCENRACTCDAGWANCNGSWGDSGGDGCEVPLGTLTDCTGCGDACDDGNECTDEVCDPASGCQNPAVSNGTECGSRYCSGLEWRRETCLNGQCTADALQRDCDDGEMCTNDFCSDSGGCSHTDNNGVDCGSTCGGLTWSHRVCGSGTCNLTTQNCDDSNVCTNDSCGALAGCGHTNVGNGTDCGSTCAGLEWSHRTCQSGSCALATQSCDDGNTCTTDACAATAGCSNTYRGDGVDCGSTCSSLTWNHRTCGGGTCNNSPQDCNDGAVCTNDACGNTTGCSHTDNNGVECGSRYCNALEWRRQTCQGGTCSSSALQQNCNDGEICTNDACAAATGCSTTNNNGVECGSRYCNALEWRRQTCASGTCSSSALQQDCADTEVCTNDACAAATGCSHTNNTNPCNDSLLCTENDVCSGGTCAGTPKVCNDSLQCTDDACNPSTGNCVYTSDDSNTCSDSNACTVGDHCVSGVCQSTPKDCADTNPCTDDSCEAGTGNCLHTNDDSNTCSDSDPCTVSDHCASGACQSTPKDCADTNDCTDDSCQAGTGTCQHTNDDSNTCSDDDECTTGDHCVSGTCEPTGANDCDDGNPCTDDSCNAGTGECENVNDNSNTCSDGLSCTSSDHCSAGSCVGTSTCDTNEVCTSTGCKCGGTGADCAGTPAESCCGTDCVALTADPNCGACGQNCAGHAYDKLCYNDGGTYRCGCTGDEHCDSGDTSHDVCNTGQHHCQ